MAKTLAELLQVDVAAAPTAGQGLALGSDGKVPDPVAAALTPWQIDIHPALYKAVVGAWTVGTNANAFGGYNTSSGTQNDEITWDVVLGAGTWTVEVLIVTANNMGIYSVQLNSVEKGTFDGYTVGTTYNVKKSVTGVVVLATTKYELKLKMATKNAASASYFAQVQWVQLRRTA